MSELSTSRLIKKPDETEYLLLKQAHLWVMQGPDEGLEYIVTQPTIIIGSGEECHLQLNDRNVSRKHLELTISEKGYCVQDLGSKNGTYLGGTRVGKAWLTSLSMLKLGQTVLQIAPLQMEVEYPISAHDHFGDLLGQSIAMRRIFAMLEKTALNDSTILLEGESGTGKDLAAQGIHQLSSRKEQAFVVVDCGSIPENLIDSELFGHERGAFTGAEELRLGALEQADGGTLFLDEIGELSLASQPRLLRFLERQEVKRLGGTTHKKINVRVIAATNRNLANEIKKGTFREDLFFRLSVVKIELPPLRDRSEDILLLAHHFAQRHVADPRTILTEDIEAILLAYYWPGNVRELRNVMERLAYIPHPLHETLFTELPPSRSGAAPDFGALLNLPLHEARARWQDILERQYLVKQLERANGVIAHAAKQSQLARPTFYRLMHRHGLKEPEAKEPPVKEPPAKEPQD
jgi:transcriptional regulator with GAF, ATPase, and Fis domain